MRSIVFLLVILSLLLCSCGSSSVELSDSKRQEIEAAWNEEFGSGPGMWFDPENIETGYAAPRYYGNYEGYDIIFEKTDLAVISTEAIAGETFEGRSSFILWAYSNGEFIFLKDAYEEGLISANSIKKIAKIHSQYQKDIYGTFPTEQ